MFWSLLWEINFRAEKQNAHSMEEFERIRKISVIKKTYVWQPYDVLDQKNQMLEKIWAL